jgi:holo-[acyl-carrier protein] synthase
MILGIGNDVVSIERVALTLKRHGARFRARVFTKEEIKLAQSRKGERRTATYATRFAAKEAAVKALGTGLRGGITFRDVETLSGPHGKPTLTLHGAALKRLNAITPQNMQARLHVSLSDEFPYAWALVIIEILPCTAP